MTDTTTTLPPARPVPAAAWGRLLGAEARMVARDTAGLVIPVALPVLLLLVNGLGREVDTVLPTGATVMDGVVMPLTTTMVVALVGVVNMPSFLATYRRYGILRRLAVTPAHPAMVLTAQMLVSAAQVVLGVGLMLGVGLLVLGVTLPAAAGWAAVVGVLVLAAMYGVGTLIAGLALSVNAGLAAGLVVFFVMLATGGGFGPVADLPDALRTVGEYLPYGAGTQALAAAWAGEQPPAVDLAVLGGWALVAGGLAARFFRWT